MSNTPGALAAHCDGDRNRLEFEYPDGDYNHCFTVEKLTLVRMPDGSTKEVWEPVAKYVRGDEQGGTAYHYLPTVEQEDGSRIVVGDTSHTYRAHCFKKMEPPPGCNRDVNYLETGGAFAHATAGGSQPAIPTVPSWPPAQ